ncbi:MAG: methyltransferase domain-containing protein [Chloroflexi bacterium]|nr:methyltransferase domain-containing protein [Chloroflexota bacterium]
MPQAQAGEFEKYVKDGAYHWQALRPGLHGWYAHATGAYQLLLRQGLPWQGKRVLDLGSGDGALTWLLAAEGARAIGVDLSTIGLQLGRREFARRGRATSIFTAARADQLPFADRSFDTVVMCEVIEHVEDPTRVLAEVTRVLAANGILLLSTPCRLAEQPDPTHYQEFFPDELRRLLERYFREVQVQPVIPAWLVELYSPMIPPSKPLIPILVNLLAILGWNPFLKSFRSRYYFKLIARCAR